ncbi:MAG: aminoacyl-tRNA hydrolase [Ruminococcus sp.]|nr:aminoacyl-tRNA hydrolase [Oscillospiraceae bacterium]MBQ7186242.1 aminoacyl-tRNA hydrolase [Ruminococcus sp.]
MSIWDVFDRISKKEEPQGGKPEFIIAGLGNPGIDYERSRHNAGFMAMSAIEEKLGVSVNTYKFKAKTAVASVGGKQCLLMKPETFMNLSGEAIAQAMSFYKIPIENVLVIFDDISLDVGVMRIRRKGSAGGHNGLKSIIECCGSEDFPRIKIGIGKKPHPDYDLKDWVLGRFTDEEREKLSGVFANVLPAAELILQGKTGDAMNKFN